MTTSIEKLSASLAGRYSVEREIGQGGMATVFLAHDIRHTRKVAVKVLRPELAAVIGAERFLAEIRTTAGLQHPHILPLHDSGEADGTVFYVMPFVEGESLRDRLNREKQLPVDDALRIAREVAGALDYAHRHGVVHRDIKPENILLHDGQALVADFGIALAVSRSDGASRMTETGMSLGTPQYMAPEQAMGEREISPKADVYALGAVLYEMLTGDPPFTGSTAQAIVARTITESPRPMLAQRHTIPPHVESAVLTALEKLPADRFATPGEFAAALDERTPPRHTTKSERAAAPAQRDWKSRAAIPLAGVSFLSLAALAWMAFKSAPPQPVSRYRISFTADQAPNTDRGIAVSDDGSHLLFLGPDSAGGLQLYLKARDHLRAVPVPGTSGAQSFAFSPKGDWIVFGQTNQLKKIPLAGGAAIVLADSIMQARGMAWLDDDRIVFVKSGGRRIAITTSAGGGQDSLLHSDTLNFWFPTALPKSRGVLIRTCRLQDCSTEANLWAFDVGDRTFRIIERSVAHGQYIPTGHLMFVRRDGAMLMAPFDVGSLATTSSPRPVLDSVALGLNGVPVLAVSKQGTLFYRTGPSGVRGQMYQFMWVNRSGIATPVDTTFRFRVTSFGANVGWSLSSDGSRVAFGRNTEAGDQIWVKPLPNGPASRVTFDSVQNFRPRWMSDQRTVMFTSRRALNAMLYKRAADGTGRDELVLKIREPGIFEGAWSPDRKYLVLRGGGVINQSGGRDIMIMQMGADTLPRPLIASPTYDESAIAISPDGKWIAYESNETGPAEVFIRPFPDADGGRWQVSSGGGRAPLWSRNGRELFFVTRSRDMAVVSVAGGTSPNVGTPKQLFRLEQAFYLSDQENYTPYDIHPDGLRFLMARSLGSDGVPLGPITMVDGWFSEVRGR